MGRKHPPRRGLLPKTQVGPTTISHIRPETGPLQRQDSTGPFDGRSYEDYLKLRDELQGLITEAHGLLKDLRVETRQARRVLPMIVSKRISAELEKQLGEMGERISEAMDASVAKVGREFDKLSDTFLGKDHTARKAGLRPLPEIVDAFSHIRDPELEDRILRPLPTDADKSDA